MDLNIGKAIHCAERRKRKYSTKAKTIIEKMELDSSFEKLENKDEIPLGYFMLKNTAEIKYASQPMITG